MHEDSAFYFAAFDKPVLKIVVGGVDTSRFDVGFKSKIYTGIKVFWEYWPQINGCWLC